MSCDLEQIRMRGFRLAALPSLAAVLACLVGSPASAADGAAPRFSGLPPTVWVMGDFNGDRKSDLAILGTASPKGEGHRLHVQLDLLQLPALTNSPAGFRLSVLDLDGDAVDSPELTTEDFARMKPATEVLPSAIYDALVARRRGERGPQKAPTKVATKLRIDPDVLDAYKKAHGKGWQTRMNEVLRDGLRDR